jgi:hypothetical protein
MLRLLLLLCQSMSPAKLNVVVLCVLLVWCGSSAALSTSSSSYAAAVDDSDSDTDGDSEAETDTVSNSDSDAIATNAAVDAAAFGSPVGAFASWRSEASGCRDGTFANLQSFVQFMGYPRSGHTLIAMLLDAHPDVALSNEINLLEKWDKFATAFELEMLVVNKVLARYAADRPQKPKKHAKNEVGHYNYRVPGAWQGRWRCLRVLGDKKGSSTTAGLQRDWNGTLAKLRWFESNLHVPVKFFHVIRNPFDNIATMITRGLNVRTHNATDRATMVAAQWDDSWDKRVERWIGLFETNVRFALTLPPGSVLHVHDFQLLGNATHETQRWCAFLSLECPARFSAAVARVLFRQPWRSRDRIPWSSRARRRIDKFLREHELLQHYSFEGN